MPFQILYEQNIVTHTTILKGKMHDNCTVDFKFLKIKTIVYPLIPLEMNSEFYVKLKLRKNASI